MTIQKLDTEYVARRSLIAEELNDFLHFLEDEVAETGQLHYGVILGHLERIGAVGKPESRSGLHVEAFQGNDYNEY